MACLVPAHAGALTKVEWQSGPEKSAESLVLHFGSGIPAFEVDMEPWGLSFWFPKMELDPVAAEGIRVVAERDGTRLRVERPGIEIRRWAFDAEAVRIVIARRVQGPVASSRYQVGVGDVVTIAVYKNPDLSGDFTVAPDGALSLPLIGSLPAVGLTDIEIAERLRRVLDKDFLVDPQVSATVKTYQSQYTYVTGAVPRAARIALGPGMSIKDVLAEAGIAMGPDQVVVLSRVGAEGDAIPLDPAALEAADCPVPRNGDVLTVQEPSYVYMQGEVRRPGRVPYASDMTVLQAISIAEGLTEWASKRDVRILRTVDGKTVEEVVNLKKIEERKVPIPKLRSGDLVLVKRKIL